MSDTGRAEGGGSFGELGELVDNLINQSPLGIFLYALDDHGQLIFRGSNQTACELLRINCRELIGKRIEDAFPSLVTTNLPETYKRLAREGGTWQWEQVDYVDKRIQGAYSVHAFQTSPGRVAVVFLDISERIKAELTRDRMQRKMQQAQKLESLGVLAGGIAHDFNNLLCVILGGADLALSELFVGHPAREGVEMVRETAKRATDLCRQMLAYSGKGKFCVEPLDLGELVRGMESLLHASISKKTALHLDSAADGLPGIEGDATQMRQVVLNLVLNASEALGEGGGVVSLRLGGMECDDDYLRSTYFEEAPPSGHYAYIEISDTGCGMDKTTLAKLFDPFFSTKKTGRGLGLAAVLGIVRGHSGTVKVYSEIDRGTTFKVLIPASEKKRVAEASPAAEGVWRGAGVVLLIDDEPAVRRVGKMMLERLGFEVLTAPDGVAALEMFQANRSRVKLVILDMTMPVMNGEETFRELRRLDAGVRVVLTSGYNAQDATSRFAGKGLAGFMQKPFMLKTMREAISSVLPSSE